ncbi:hypothetical protein Leryth_018846 [Lithospermum erythrorhizon]|nr:hypothetical protein Leryth_018846 [Lithospermum erythrorhizon]
MNQREAMIQHRRGLSINGISKDSDYSQNQTEVSVKLGRLSLGSARGVKSPLDDLLTSIDSGKHDYDWLLTPPETPMCPSSDGNDYLQAAAPPRSSSSVRTVSTTKSSRLSNSQSESNQTGRLSRSNSLTRQSASSFQYSSYSNKSTNILNTSSASVSSYIRPSTPSRSSSTARPSTPTSRSTSSRPSTPSRARPAPSTSSIDRSRPSQTSRSSTPSSRPQISAANLSSQGVRSTSRPSTPTRRNSAPLISQVSGSSTSINRASSNVRNVPSVSRPSSPGPRARSVPQPIVLPDFSLDTPPNLRTTLPDRPLSAGRSRPGAAVNAKSTLDAPSVSNPPRRQPSPIGTRGRSAEPSARNRISSGHPSHVSESHRTSHVSDSSSRKPLKASTDSTGFGRTISKRSLDMAIRHMDIKNGANGVRGIPGSNLFPQSVRSASMKSQATHTLHPPSQWQLAFIDPVQ